MIWRRLLMTSVACFEYAGLCHLHTHLCYMQCALEGTHTHTHMTHTHTRTHTHRQCSFEHALLMTAQGNLFNLWLDYSLIRIRAHLKRVLIHTHTQSDSLTLVYRVIRGFFRGICHCKCLLKADNVATLPHSATAANHSREQRQADLRSRRGRGKSSRRGGLTPPTAGPALIKLANSNFVQQLLLLALRLVSAI